MTSVPVVNNGAVKFESALMSGNAAKWLAMQLAQFSGAEEENVNAFRK